MKKFKYYRWILNYILDLNSTQILNNKKKLMSYWT